MIGIFKNYVHLHYQLLLMRNVDIWKIMKQYLGNTTNKWLLNQNKNFKEPEKLKNNKKSEIFKFYKEQEM